MWDVMWGVVNRAGLGWTGLDPFVAVCAVMHQRTTTRVRSYRAWPESATRSMCPLGARA